MKLELITDMAPEIWDEAIEAFDSKCLFHQSVWLRYLEETQGARTLRFRITDNGRTGGYFVGLIVKKGPLRIMGSPLPGWTTDYMGPVVNKDFDFEKFLDALDHTCRTMKIHHIELCSQFLSPDLMRSRGYSVQDSSTFIIPLSEDVDQMWRNLDRKCRQNIRKGISNNLVVEECDDPAVIDEHHAELVDVFAKQKLVPTYPVERVRSLFRILSPGSIIVLRVRQGEKVIATALLPYDNRCVYLFGAASWRTYQSLYPNELLYWTAMTMFAKKGMSLLDMCGDGNYKAKYGAVEVPVYKYAKSYNVVARLGREAYRKMFRMKQELSGRLSAWGPSAA
jgi:hypothetical protein